MASKFKWCLSENKKFFFDYKEKLSEHENVELPHDKDSLISFFNALFDNAVSFPFVYITDPYGNGIALSEDELDVNSAEFKKKKNLIVKELKSLKELKTDESHNSFWNAFFEYVEPEYDIDEEEPLIDAAPDEGSEVSQPAGEPVSPDVTDDGKKPEIIQPVRCDFSLEESKAFFEGNRASLQSFDNEIEVHSNIDIFENMNISFKNNMYIEMPASLKLSNNIALVTSLDNSNVLILGHLEKIKNDGKTRLYFVARKENIDFDSLNKSVKFNLILVDRSFDQLCNSNISDIRCRMYQKEVRINTEESITTNQPLCIDFGTSGTTVGSFGIKDKSVARNPELVEFVNVLDGSFSNICPTIVYVDDCSNRDDIRYLFGFEASRKMIELEYCPEATIIFEIKKWVGATAKDVITIYDKDGNRQRHISEKSIVKAYIRYIIDYAEDYFGVKFKKIHFTAPVKLKTSFIKFMERLFKDEYEIYPAKDAVDEAVAVIYDYISKKNISTMSPGDKESVIVIDCGGGTTDLVECSIELKQLDPYPVFNIQNNSGNGDINFGGNNITYKIMQLIKVKTYDYINGLSREVLEKSESFILETIDKMYESDEMGRSNILDTVYKSFFNCYDECENLIPTKFEADISDEKKEKVKRNFYYLWNFAEQIKIKFFGEDKVMVDKDTYLDLENTKKNTFIYICNADNGKMEKFDNPFDEIKISIKEIRKLICGDIYMTLLKILPENPESFDKYFLSGQSCKISLFNELLKEFIPGKKLRNKIDEDETFKESFKFKLNCINGSINYTASQKSGNDGEKPIKTVSPKQSIYSVRYKFATENSSNKFGILTEAQEDLDMVIENLRDHSKDERTYSLPDDVTYEKIASDKLENKLRTEMSFKDEDDLTNALSKLQDDSLHGRIAFTNINEDGYGFSIMFIKKDKNSEGGFDYRISTDIYSDSFEKSKSYFFDGKR